MKESKIDSCCSDIVAMIIIAGVIVFIGWMGYIVGIHKNPTAIDVYKGKTTLEITYKDGIPIDSIVVFKK